MSLLMLAKRLQEKALELTGRAKRPRGGHSPDIEVLGNSDELIRKMLRDELPRFRDRPTVPRYLDVGGRRGERADLAIGYEYLPMDIEPRADNVVVGDICRCPEIADDSFDVVASFDVFEHLQRPWDAARECVRITRPGGLVIHRTLFAYRYHPVPVDYWRFSAQGLEYLFVDTGEIETVTRGYDLRGRRRNRMGMPMRGNVDVPPLDFWGGFRENWRVLYVGRKKSRE